jgi:Tfp pilus assembly PilM family ATPase
MLLSHKTGWIGFDFGATSVKAAQIVRKNREYQLRSAVIVPRRTRWNSAELMDEPPASSVDECLAALSLDEKFQRGASAALLPMAAGELFQIDALPARRGNRHEDLVRAVEVESARSIGDWVFDSWPADADGRRVNVFGAPRLWSDGISDDVTATGSRCHVIDALPWALARAALMQREAAQQTTIAALDWGYGKATLCLIHDGLPKMVRTLKDCAFQAALAEIQASLRLSESDAEMALAQHAASRSSESRPERDVFSRILEEPTARLVHELQKTLSYWRGATRGLAPQALYLFGGGALTGAASRLEQALHIPTQPWQLPLSDDADQAAVPPICLFGPAAGLSELAWRTA